MTGFREEYWREVGKGKMMENNGSNPKEEKRLRIFSPEYYTVCAVGGMLSAGTTHLAITPLDVLKVNMQVSLIRKSEIGKIVLIC